MAIDNELLVSDKQAVTADAVSTDAISIANLLGADRSRNLRCFCQVETSFTPDGAATGITFEIIGADNSALNSSVVSLYSVTVTNGSSNVNLAAGKSIFDQPLPKTNKAWLGYRYTTNAGDYTTGKVTGGITLGTDTALADRPTYETHGF